MKIHIVIDMPEMKTEDEVYDSGIIDRIVETNIAGIKEKDWWVEIEK